MNPDFDEPEELCNEDEELALLRKVKEVLPERATDAQVGALLSWILSCYGVSIDRTRAILISVASHQKWLDENTPTEKDNVH